MHKADEFFYRASLAMMAAACILGIVAICHGLATGNDASLDAGSEAVQTGLLIGVSGKVFREW